MATRHRLRLLLPRRVRELPADLAAVLVYVVATNAVVLLPVVSETPVRVVFGLPFVLFIPGYAFIAALFPEAGTGSADADTDADSPPERRGIDGIERVALSFGLSIAVVPLIGLALNFTPFGIRLVPIMVSLTVFTLLATAVAAYRRRALPAEERFRVPYRAWLAAGREELFEPDSRTDAALNVLLAVSVILAASAVGYAVAVPQQGESFSEFYLLTEQEDGELIADDYPTEFVRGEPKPVVVGIGNQEYEPVSYTVVIQLQEVRLVDNGTNVTVERRAQLRRYTTELEHNTTGTRQVQLQPTFAGDRLRLQFLLYRGPPPETPTADSSYRELHLWINVSRAG
jgi:uncharacterized membrane protein